MYESDAALLDAKLVAVRPLHERHKGVYSPECLVNHVASIGDVYSAGNTDIASVVGQTPARVHAALETLTRRAPGDRDRLVAEDVEVRVGGGLDDGPRVALCFRDGTPQAILARGVVKRAGSVEGPVALLGHERLHLDELATLVAHLGAD